LRECIVENINCLLEHRLFFEKLTTHSGPLSSLSSEDEGETSGVVGGLANAREFQGIEPICDAKRAVRVDFTPSIQGVCQVIESVRVPRQVFVMFLCDLFKGFRVLG
jgi:hypothetical protein